MSRIISAALIAIMLLAGCTDYTDPKKYVSFVMDYELRIVCYQLDGGSAYSTTCMQLNNEDFERFVIKHNIMRGR